MLSFQTDWSHALPDQGRSRAGGESVASDWSKGVAANPDGACPLLDNASGNCLIYESRPFGCRTHFCAAAGGPYSRREVIDLIRRLEAVDETLGGTGPRLLQNAMGDALSEL